MTAHGATPWIERLWRSRAESILGQIAAGGTDYEEVANLAEHVGADYHGRFLIELLQNAEDQATRMALDDATVMVVRTRELLAVFNQGSPFNEKGINAITSAGISPKDAEKSLGNKGIGFKAVFQVSGHPEIYSAADGDRSTLHGRISAFRLDQAPFEDAQFMKRFQAVLKDILAGDHSRRQQLEARFTPEALIDCLIAEFKKAAPFKFPKPLGAEALERRMGQLGVPPRIAHRMSSVVVLPILPGEKTAKVIDNAFDEIANEATPGASLLFLQGTARLRLYDRVRGRSCLICRDAIGSEQRLARGARLSAIRTQVSLVTSQARHRHAADWRLVRRRLGRDGDDPDTRESERVAIKAAASELPGPNWSKVEAAHAAVALPTSLKHGDPPGLLTCVGRVCIGLPTRQASGTPVWVDGPFHGNVARTAVDLETEFNRLIFDEAVRLFWQAVNWIAQAGCASDKRWMVSSLNVEEGPLAGAIKADKTLSTRPLVLSRDGVRMLAPAALRIPPEEDADKVDCLLAGADLDARGFLLPDSWVLRNCRHVIEVLAADQSIEVARATYLERNSSGESLLEEAARLNRAGGKEWWAAFLAWVIESFELSDLRDCAMLPVLGERLMKPSQSVFFRPLAGKGASDDDAEGEEAIDDLGDELLASLQFVDEACIQVRRNDQSRQLTELARALSPEAGGGLIRRPRKVELINDVLAPELVRRSAAGPSDPLCAPILARIADWLEGMPVQMRARVDLSRVVVPTGEERSLWKWRAGKEVYFGAGWLEEPRATLLQSAYGARLGGMIAAWRSFAGWAGAEEAERAAWRSRLATLGVNDLPRLLVENPRQAFFKSWSYSRLTVEGSPDCPIPTATKYWADYLSYASARPASTASGQTFFLSSVAWIDGLESESAREPIVELVLSNPAGYESALTAIVQRHDRSDARSVQSLWVHAAWARAWLVIPTEKEPRAPGETWALGPEERGRRFVEADLIAALPDEFNRSRAMLEAFGVFATDRAPIPRLIKELQHLGTRIGAHDGPLASTISTLAQVLYEWLNRRCESTSAKGDDLKLIRIAPLPLLRGTDLVAASIEGSVLYLNDDPQRAARIPGFSTSLSLPISAKGAFEALFSALKELLGPERVKRVSAERVALPFEPDVGKPGGLFLELLVQRPGGSEVTDLRRDLAAVIAYGRDQHPMDPGKEAFKRHWERVCATRVVFGTFPPGDGTVAFFDEKQAQGPALFVAAEAVKQSLDLVRFGWHLVGVGHQDAFELFNLELSAGRRDDFFRRKGVRETEWDEIDAVIGLAADQLKQRLRPIGLSGWLRLGHHDIGGFEEAWARMELSASSLASWLGIDEPIAAHFLAEARYASGADQQVRLLEAVGVTVKEWQQARHLLGLELYRFPESLQRFQEAAYKLGAAVAVATSRYATVSVDTAVQLVGGVRQMACPDEIAEKPASEAESLAAALSSAAEALERRAGGSGGLRMLARGLRKEAQRRPSSWSELQLRGAPQRELRKFVDFDEEQRSAEARQAVEAVMRVAVALEQRHGVILSSDIWKQSSRVTRFTEGWWSNPYAALRTLRRLLMKAAPATASMLLAKRAFAGPMQWTELWTAFPELGAPYQTANDAPRPPPRTVRIFGEEKVLPEIEAELSLGSAGSLGCKLAACAAPAMDLAALAAMDREQVPHTQPSSKPRGGGGNRRRGQVDQRVDDLVGLLGEIVVYEHFRQAGYPDFSAACWVSENRGKYLGGPAEAVESGYDFKYRDVSGKLSGRRDSPLCLIEVKSSSGDGASPFSTTWPEWLRAQECHVAAGDSVYIIVRVRDALGNPQIHEVIVDPIQHQKNGTLGVKSKDLLVHVGATKEGQ